MEKTIKFEEEITGIGSLVVHATVEHSVIDGDHHPDVKPPKEDNFQIKDIEHIALMFGKDEFPIKLDSAIGLNLLKIKLSQIIYYNQEMFFD